jgi:hypothetical protein
MKGTSRPKAVNGGHRSRAASCAKICPIVVPISLISLTVAQQDGSQRVLVAIVNAVDIGLK